MEPVFLLFWSVLMVGLASTPVTIYVSSLPIYAGAVVCGMTEVDFSWFALAFGLSSNMLLTGRNVIAKSLMATDKPATTNEGPSFPSMESNSIAALALFQMSALPAVVCLVGLVICVCFSSLPVTSLMLDWQFMLSGVFFAMMRHSSTMLLQIFSLLAHSLVKLSRRFFFIFVALWIAHKMPTALHVTGLMLVLCGASSMDITSRVPRWWAVLIAFIVTGIVSGSTYLTFSGSWWMLFVYARKAIMRL
jgi:hypothetical protein